ncbi:ATP-binding cassette domain-containing protein [Mycobacterium sp. NPDC050551]|uniref:ATP-binding cassette domain-containing protein n=1 Tax=Mycobacterium sp. NPDC050551 TaxID=3155407 RepID=UPI00344300EC
MTTEPAGAAHPAVAVEGVGKSFGDVTAVRDITFHIDRGEVVGLLGPNGAGKSTLVDILSTLTGPDTGRALVAGFDVATRAAEVRKKIMLTGQQVAVDTMLTGRQNLVMFARLQGLRKAAARIRADELLAEFELTGAADRRVSTYSGGMRRRIDIACGLVVRPDVVFLDEPTTGLDPRSRQGVWNMVRRFKSEGITTLLTTQYLEEADALSDRIILIDQGVVIAEGTPQTLKGRTGASFCEVVPRDPADVARVAALMRPLLPPDRGDVAVAVAGDRVTMPAPDGATTLLRVLTELAASGVDVADVVLRRPSLDDVFLSLTGNGAAPAVDALS